MSDQLPLLVTPKRAGAMMGITDSQVRALVHSGRLAHVLVGKRIMIPPAAIEQFIKDNTVLPCLAETPALVSASSKSATASTFAGRSEVAAGSAARALQIAEGLKSPSRSSSQRAIAPPAPVIPLRSS